MENIYYILMMAAIVGMGCFVFLGMQIKRMAINMMEHEHRLASLDRITENHMDMISKLCAKVQDLDKEMDTSREAVENWSEAAKIARKSEEDYNEGLNNILNFQPTVKQKGDKN